MGKSLPSKIIDHNYVSLPIKIANDVGIRCDIKLPRHPNPAVRICVQRSKIESELTLRKEAW